MHAVNFRENRPLDSLYFFHIPKTAGTSLRHWLEDLFGRDDWLPCYILDEVAREDPERVKQYRFFSGHFGWKLFDYLDHRPPTITWLRHPVQRLISHHDFNRNRHPELVAIAARNQQPGWIEYYNRCLALSLPELCTQEEFYGYNDNMQTRYLAGVFPHRERILLEPKDLQRAKQNLARLTFVGICEWMAPSIDALCHQLHCPVRPLTHRFNSRDDHGKSAKTTLAGRELEIVTACESYDLQLYEFGRELFRLRFLDLLKRAGCLDVRAEQLDTFLSAYDTRPETSQLREFIQQEFQSSRPQTIPPTELQIDFADAALVSGWYPRTKLDTGQSLRWAGPERSASIYLPLKAGVEYELSFVVRYVLSFEILKSIRVGVGDHEFPVTWTPHSDDFGGRHQYLVSARVRADANRPREGWSEVRIVTDGPLQPFLHNPSQLASFATDGFHLRELGTTSATPVSSVPIAPPPQAENQAA